MRTTRVRHTERRRSRRYRPPAGFRPEIRRGGWKGLLDSNLCKACLNVSEGGMRLILTRRVEVGDALRARLGGHEVAVRVGYAVPSGAHPGCWEAGLTFADPAPPFRAWLRDSLLRWCAPLLPGPRGDAWGEAR